MLPEQIRKQVEQADEMVKQLSLVPATPVEDSVPEVTPVEDSAPEVTPVEIPQFVAPIEAEPVASATPAQLEMDLEPHADEWETKYKVLQGKYNAEVPRLQTQLREFQTHIDRLQGAMTVLQRSAAPAPAAAAPVKASSNVKPEEVEEYGADFIDMIERAALQRVAPQIDEMQNTIKNLMGQLSGQVSNVAQKQHQTDEQRFFAKVGEGVPNWQSINVTPEWLSYLSEPDPMTGITRQVYLDDARRSLDVGRVVNIFKSFTGNTTVSEPEPNSAPKRSDALAKQVQPGRTKAAVPVSGAPAGPVSRGDITKLYDDHRKGLYKGKEDEFRRKEIALLDAINDGRLQ